MVLSLHVGCNPQGKGDFGKQCISKADEKETESKDVTDTTTGEKLHLFCFLLCLSCGGRNIWIGWIMDWEVPVIM